MMEKVTVTPYEDGTVNHATMDKMSKITETVFAGHVHQLSISNTDEQIKNYTFG